MANKREVDMCLVDRERLLKAISKKKLNPNTLSEDMGFSRTYLTSSVGRDGKISKTCALLLESKYGIKYDDYKPIVEEKPVGVVKEVVREVVKDVNVNIDYDRLYKVIYGAVLDAMNQSKKDIHLMKREIASVKGDIK